MKISEFIDDTSITSTCRKVGDNPNMPHDMDHWLVTLKLQGRRLTIPYSQGYGYKGEEPKLANVLECLVMDCSCDTSNFDNFCIELGYNNDSIKDFNVFKATRRIQNNLANFLGDLINTFKSLEVD